ncbi:MAG: hypothetical protein U0610_13000 [bacterium]
MTTKWTALLAVGMLAMVTASSSARAEEFDAATISNQPASTLLLPYFDVTLKNPDPGTPAGPNTYMTIVNTSASATMAHLTVWSDLGVPVFGFDVYLTGYDAQEIDLGDVIRNGKLPVTASAGQDPTDTLSPHGDISQDINFASCNGILPPVPLAASELAHVQAALSGQYSAVLGGCAGRSYGDGLARGFVTVDVTNACTLLSPADVGYFVNGGGGIAGNRNILTGDYAYVNASKGYSEGDSLVAIQTSSTDPETSVAGQYTFYGKHVGFDASDNRQPLATLFGSRFRHDDTVFTKGTNLVAWRDPKVATTAFTCGTTPSWYPLGQEQIVIFDEQEHPVVPVVYPVSPPPPVPSLIPFPAVANKVKVGSAAFPVPYENGWVFTNLNTTVTPAGAVPPEDPAAAQAWVTTVFAGKAVHAGSPSAPMDSATHASHQHIGF